MESGKLNESTTQKDPDNVLLDQIRRQAETGEYFSALYKSSGKSERYDELREAALEAMESLRKYEDEILHENRKRKEETFTLDWMVPSKVQASLNI